MKRIGIDARLISQTGVGVYIRNMLHYFATGDLAGYRFLIYVLPEDAHCVPSHEAFQVRLTSARWHGIAEQTVFLFQLVRDRLDLMHFTYFSWPLLYPGAFVATVHDTTPLDHDTGKLFHRNKMVYRFKKLILATVFSRLIYRACEVIVPTHAVADLIMRRYGREALVIPEGVSYELLESNAEPVLQLQNKDFVLRVGNCYPHKNIGRLLSVCTHLPLVMVGPKNSFSIEYATSYPSQIWLYDIPTPQLKWLYEHALCMIMPSFAEGFGLPVVEALSLGCPVVCSDIPVLREVAGEDGVYFDPSSSKEMLQALSVVWEAQSGRETEEKLRLGRMRAARLAERGHTFALLAERIRAVYTKHL